MIERAFALAMEPRLERLDDDHHPAFLHPGRTMLIVLRDVGDHSAVDLAAGALMDSEDADLRVPVGRLPDALGPDVGEQVAEAVRRSPKPGDERLTEQLVGLPRGLCASVLAERLDHLRHLHLRPDLRPIWAERHEEVEAAWLPVARRTHELLGRRYAHWARTFSARL